MSLVVPSTHAARPHYDKVASFKTQITNNTNPTLTNALKHELVQTQRQLVDTLMADGSLPASAILNTMTFGAADTNA